MPIANYFAFNFLSIGCGIFFSLFWKGHPEMDKFLLFIGAKAGVGDNRNANTIVLLNNRVDKCSQKNCFL